MLWHEGLSAWVATDYRTCERVLRDSQLFAADDRRVGDQPFNDSVDIQSTDPPEHTELQTTLVRALRQQSNSLDAQAVSELSSDLLGQLTRSGGDLVHDFAFPLACEVTMRLVGAPTVSTRLLELSRQVVESLHAGLTPETRNPGLLARAELGQHIVDWLTDEAAGGLIAGIQRTWHDRFDLREKLSNSVRIFLLSGLNSLYRMVGLAALSLLRDPSAFDQFAASSPSLRGTAITELMRFDSPGQAQSRRITADTWLAGQRIERGATIVALIGGANRDPDVFDEPDSLRLDRQSGASLALGCGPHACLGGRTTRIALLGALPVLTAKIDRRRHVVGEPTFDRNPTLRGVTEMAIRPTK